MQASMLVDLALPTDLAAAQVHTVSAHPTGAGRSGHKIISTCTPAGSRATTVVADLALAGGLWALLQPRSCIKRTHDRTIWDMMADSDIASGSVPVAVVPNSISDIFAQLQCHNAQAGWWTAALSKVPQAPRPHLQP